MSRILRNFGSVHLHGHPNPHENRPSIEAASYVESARSDAPDLLSYPERSAPPPAPE